MLSIVNTTMGSAYSCPQGYEMIKETLYKSTLRLCLQKDTIQLTENKNLSVITDIASAISGIEDIRISFITILCFVLTCFILMNR